MNRQLVHMRDQKASLIAMEKYRRQQAFQQGLDHVVMVVSLWAIALIISIQ